MGWWFGLEHTQCPNCSAPDEDAAHLLHCRDPGHFSLFRSEVNKFALWLSNSHTDPIIAWLIPDYIMSHGAWSLLHITPLSLEYYSFVFRQDLIGWDNFMLGMVTYRLHLIQHSHLLNSPSTVNVDDWMSHFISWLFHVTHGQWIYHNTLGMI